MRKIETEMNRAILKNKCWKKGSTEVNIEEDGTITVRLHNSLIAIINPMPYELKISSAGYPTRTTCSRLNALVGRFYKVNIKQGSLVLSKLNKKDFTIVNQRVITEDFAIVA